MDVGYSETTGNCNLAWLGCGANQFQTEWYDQQSQHGCHRGSTPDSEDDAWVQVWVQLKKEKWLPILVSDTR